MTNEKISTIILIVAFIIFPICILFKLKKNTEKEEKTNVDVVTNNNPIKVELYDVVEFTQYYSDMDGSSTMVRLSPIFKDINTGQLYIHSRFERLGDMKINYDYSQSEIPKLQVKTKNGKIINENETGHIYIKETIGPTTYYNNLLDIGNGKYEYKGKLKNYYDVLHLKGNYIFNIMKDNFINEIQSAIVIDAHIDFDMDDKSKINPDIK